MSLQNKHGEIPAAAIFFAAYVGPSMHPALCEPEIMEVRPYAFARVRVGDVVLFVSPQLDRPVVHRILRVTPAGIATRGDNNIHEDIGLLQANEIKGQVVAVWRGQKRRVIAGGYGGLLTCHWFRWQRLVVRILSPLLHPLYRTLCCWGGIAGALPALFRPRVVVFRRQGREEFQLLLGERRIGRYDDQKRQWQIQRPFRLFVAERILQRPQE